MRVGWTFEEEWTKVLIAKGNYLGCCVAVVGGSKTI
jgi:hypothetical protein